MKKIMTLFLLALLPLMACADDVAFSECSNLKSFSVESGNPKYNSRDNSNAMIETATNTVIASCEKSEEDTVRYKVNLQPSVIFQLGSAKIERSQIANVEMIAMFANKFKELKILVQGFAFCDTDEDTGAKTKKEWDDFHYKLSQKRADNVKEMLVKDYSIDADRIIAKGRGFTDKLSDEATFNRVVLFSAIDENGLEYVPTKVKSSVKFTAPVIKKDDDYNFYGDVVDNLSVVSFNGKSFKTVCHLEIPEAQDAQQYLSNLLFGEKNVGLKEAYGNFLKQWDRKDYTVATSVDGNININLRKEYEQYGRFACYHVTASLDGRVQILGLPQTNSVEKQKEQYFKLVNGVDYRFIVDTKQNKMVGIEQIFVPGLVDKLKGAFGADVSLYVEDRCLQLLSKKSDGRFIFNKTTEVHFTDYFKQLVGWNEIQNIDTPAFLHGQEGLEDFLKKQYVSLASEFTPADTVTVSMIILEDGSVTQPTIECKPNNYHEQKLLETCGKMPKWMPAYKDGKPVTKEAFFSIRVPRVSNEKAHDVVEIMPSFNGGMGALMQFLSSNIKYPEECEENGIQGRVICTFVVERDGSITDLKVTKPVHPLLDKEALRVLSLMPKWIPGTQKGETVRVKYTLPVTFRLK